MLPSMRLIILVMAAAPIFLGGTLYDPLAALAIIYVMILVLYAAIDALLLPRSAQIAIQRIAPDRISLGMPTRIILQIHNACKRKLTLRVTEDLPPSMETVPSESVLELAAGERRALQYHLVARKRGRYELSDIDVRVLPTLGLFYRQFRLRIPTEVHVFPNLTNIKRYDLLVRRGLAHEQGLARLRQIGQGTQFESLRQYAEGDDMSRVDWKATAKRSRLIVKNYQPERQQSVLVAIDVGRATAGEFKGVSRLDYLVNAALMLGYVTLRQGDWFSLVAFSDRIDSYLPAVRGLKSIERVARALYKLEPRLVEANYAAACQFMSLKNRKRSLICLMTDVIDRQASSVVIGYMARFVRYHLPLAVTLTNPEIHAVAEQPLAECQDPYSKAVAIDVLIARQEALTAMRQQGVAVLDVSPEALTPELVNRYIMIKSTHRL